MQFVEWGLRLSGDLRCSDWESAAGYTAFLGDLF